jgi:hypothetical protein
MVVTRREPQSERVCGPVSLTECFVSFSPDGAIGWHQGRNTSASQWLYIVFKGMAPEAGNNISEGEK